MARILVNKLDQLPDAKPHDLFWSIQQLVTRRNALVKAQVALKNQLHIPLSKLQKVFFRGRWKNSIGVLGTLSFTVLFRRCECKAIDQIFIRSKQQYVFGEKSQ
ncbi:hypothetical protein J2S17_003211 [Cytobacillus purgationiresistens]|uniref:Uncharacterized protein n=1 Tax=Cytobacillus purgationiresistens TaxID=863449 RepID=A0ABU0ALQ6_9BACI|nr:hypothetical protein [Cytobacillus purgationiresistens]